MLQHMLGKRSGTSEWLQGYGDSLGHTATNGTAIGYGRALPCASEQSSTRAAQSSTAMLLSPRTLCRGGSAITRAECYRTGKQVTSATEDIKAGTHERKANRSSCAHPPGSQRWKWALGGAEVCRTVQRAVRTPSQAPLLSPVSLCLAPNAQQSHSAPLCSASAPKPRPRGQRCAPASTG